MKSFPDNKDMNHEDFSRKEVFINQWFGSRSEKGDSLFVLLCHFAAGLGLISSLLYVIPMSRPNHYVMNYESLLAFFIPRYLFDVFPR